MLHKSADKLYPTCDSAVQLANDFANFFIDKITKIRTDLLLGTSLNFQDPIGSIPVKKFAKFTTVTDDQIANLLHNIVAKSCSLDPVPGQVLKNCFDLLLPVITKIVNLSLTTCVMPCSLMIAVLDPRLKKPSLDHEVFNNFRPISNLKIISKAIEKAV